jgi:hypothetical protein
MNPFVTNPHLLKPGDKITLFEAVPSKKEVPVQSKRTGAEETVESPVAIGNGIDVSSFTDVRSIGYLSTDETDSWGYILSGETQEMVFSEGDAVFLQMKDGYECKPGDTFLIFTSSELLTHPVTEQRMGFLLTFGGRLSVEEHVRERLYKAKIFESYRELHLGDQIQPYQPVSACVEPLPMPEKTMSNIVAVKDRQEAIGQFSVVYLAQGHNEGIRRGNAFEIVKKLEVEPPGEFSDERMTMPDLVVGHLLVLEARADTATGIVFSTTENVWNGAFVKGLDWKELPKVLLKLARCAVD